MVQNGMQDRLNINFKNSWRWSLYMWKDHQDYCLLWRNVKGFAWQNEFKLWCSYSIELHLHRVERCIILNVLFNIWLSYSNRILCLLRNSGLMQMTCLWIYSMTATNLFSTIRQTTINCIFVEMQFMCMHLYKNRSTSNE